MKLRCPYKLISTETSDDYITYEYEGTYNTIDNPMFFAKYFTPHSGHIYHAVIENDYKFIRFWVTIFIKPTYRWRRMGNAIGANQLTWQDDL